VGRAANKDIIFRILGKKVRSAYKTDLSDVPDLDMMYHNIEYSVTKHNGKLDSVEKNKLILSDLADYIKRCMEHTYGPSAHIEPMSHMAPSLAEPHTNQEANGYNEDTRAAYDKLMTQREIEHGEISAKDKGKIEQARQWLQPQNSRVRIHETPVPLDSIAEDVENITPTNTANNSKEPKRVRFKSNIEPSKHHVLTANNLEENVISFNDNLGLCDTLRIGHLILKDKLLTYEEHFDVKREVYLSQLPYLIVDVCVNGTKTASVPFFQVRTVNDTIVFETDLVLTLNDLVTEIKLVVTDESSRVINMKHELVVETMMHATQLTVTEQYNREIYDPQYFYVRIKSGNFKTGDVILINSELCAVVGTCTTSIKNANHITVTDLTNYEGHNTMILRLDKAFAMETKLQNTSRNPKCIVTTV